MPNPVADDYRSRARLLLIAAIVVDLAAVAALVIPAVTGGDISEMVPIAIPLFIASSGLLLASMALRKKGDAADPGA